MTEQEIKDIFQEAFDYAEENTTCLKVPVGACFLTPGGNKYFSCNHTNNGMEQNCVYQGRCYKAFVTGIYESCEETRKYCSATHAEVNMIDLISNNDKIPVTGSILFVTRYCCEGCAHAIVESGIDTVYYCGRQRMSKNAETLFDDNGVSYKWFPEIDFEYSWSSLKFWEILDIKSKENLQKYIDFIKNVKIIENNSDQYTERHHIVPWCTGLNIEETINIAPRDHFIAHKLLLNCFNGSLGSKLAFAFMRMASSTEKQRSAYEVTPEEYELSVVEYSKAYKEYLKENGSPNQGRKISDEVRKKISESHADVSGENNPFYGKKHSEESKKKMRESASKRNKSTYNTEAMSITNKGNKYASNSRWMNNGEVTIKVDKSLIEDYLKLGWALGRLNGQRNSKKR